ncbi:hypothetical protein RAHE111665_09970 [Rariglobus hedericola]
MRVVSGAAIRTSERLETAEAPSPMTSSSGRLPGAPAAMSADHVTARRPAGSARSSAGRHWLPTRKRTGTARAADWKLSRVSSKVNCERGGTCDGTVRSRRVRNSPPAKRLRPAREKTGVAAASAVLTDLSRAALVSSPLVSRPSVRRTTAPQPPGGAASRVLCSERNTRVRPVFSEAVSSGEERVVKSSAKAKTLGSPKVFWAAGARARQRRRASSARRVPRLSAAVMLSERSRTTARGRVCFCA